MAGGRIYAERREDMPGVLYLTISNPGSYNAFTQDMMEEFHEILRNARSDMSLRIIVLQGDGVKAFSSGLAMISLDHIDPNPFYSKMYDLGTEIRNAILALDILIISAVKGAAAGYGFELALYSDLVYCADNVRFSLPEGNLGITPGGGGCINLPKKLPHNLAMKLLLFSEKLRAQEAKDMGFVADVFPLEEFDEKFDEVIRTLLKKSPLVARGVKKLLSAVYDLDMDDYTIERDLAISLFCTEDFRNAVTAFKEKRPPEFKGK